MYGQAEFTGWTVATGTGDLAQREEGREMTTTIGAKIEREAEKRVIAAAIAFMDQLCSFNDYHHPEVHRRALDLSYAVSEYHKYGNAGRTGT